METEHIGVRRDARVTTKREAGHALGFRHVLVCLDRSDAAASVLPLAAHLAQVDGARMTILHVIRTLPDSPNLRATDALECEIVRQEAGAYLSQLAAGIEALGIEAETQVVEGSGARGDCFTTLASDLDADVLVLSTEWTDGEPLTAATQATLNHSALLLVPTGIDRAAPQIPVRRILVALDGSLRGESVLPTVLRLARADDAEILLAHAVPDPIRTEVLSDPEDLALAHELADRLTAHAEAYLQRTRSQLLAGGARARVVVCRAADHREGLVSLTVAERADLVVVSAHGAVGNPRRRFGSTTAHIIAQSRIPVLVMRDLPRRSAGGGPSSSRPPARSLESA